MIDYKQIAENLKSVNGGNRAVDVIIMEKKILRIYPNGKIFPAGQQVWIQGMKEYVSKKETKAKNSETGTTKEAGTQEAW